MSPPYGGMYSYDRQKTAAKLDVYSKWRDIVDKHDAAERKEMDALLQDMVRYLRSEGLELDVKRSHIGKYYHGSDGVRMEGTLVVAEAWNNVAQALKPDWIRKWVEAATGLYGGTPQKIGEGPKLRQVDDQPVVVWQIDISAY